MAGKLGVLVHGAGQVGAQHIKAYMNNANTHVVAISSRTIESAKTRSLEAGLKDVKLYDDLDEALENEAIDIVSVCTPQNLHASNVITIARSGKHIAIEKPVAINLSELRRMRDAVRKAKVRTVVSFVLRWNPLFTTVKSLVGDGTIGKPYYLEADYQHHLSSISPTFPVAGKSATGVSAMLTGGCHAIDAIRWLSEPKANKASNAVEVFGYSGGYRKGKTTEYNAHRNEWSRNKPPLEYNDLEVILIRLENDVFAKVSSNFGCIMPYSFPIRIFGDKGTVRDNQFWSWRFIGQRDWVTMPTLMPDTPLVAQHNFQGEIDHLIDCIKTEKESHTSLEDSINTHEIVFAAQKSYQSRRPVKLPLI